MRLRYANKMLIEAKLSPIFLSKFIVTLVMLVLTVSYSQSTFAEVWADIRDNVITNNGVVNCTECHSITKTDTASNSSSVLSRHSAPVLVNFDGTNDLDAYNNITTVLEFPGAVDGDATWADNTEDRIYERASNHVSTGYMPMNPIDGADFTDHTDLNATKMTSLQNWAIQGAPYAAASAMTSVANSLSKTGATLNGGVNVNVHAGSAVLGTAVFEYGTTTSYGAQTTAITGLSGTSGSPRSTAVSGLACDTLYNFRVVATNGSGATNGSNRTFTTTACTDPVIAGVSLVADATSQNATEDANANFAITVTDDDPGNLTWSKTNGSNGGTVTLVSPTSTSLSGSATVRYRSSSNYFGPDSFTVTVTNGTTATSHTITFNMTVNDDGADSPVISGTTTVNGNEDGVNAADGALTPIAVSVSALDGDNAPSYNWDVTASNDGMPVFSVANVATPTLLYTPLANDNGSPADTFTIRVCDGGSAGAGNCDFQVITVNLIAQQDTPVAVNDTGVNVLEGAASTLLTVISNDTDADAGQAATLVPNLASISITSGGLSLIGVTGNQIEVSHNGAEELSASLTYKVQDVNGRISALAATVSITITASDDPPTSANITVAGTVDEGTSTIVNAIAVSNDPEGATMAVCNTMTAPTSGNAAVTINGGGNIVYTHDGTDVAGGGEVDTFTYQVNDANDSTCASGNNSGFSVVTVNLAAVNDRPVAVADLITVAEGATVTILDNANTSVLTNDTDEENGVGTGFTVSANSTPGFNNGFTLNADGTFSYTHDGSENLNTSFTYTVNDGTIDSVSPGTVTINVNPINDPPVITSTAPTVALVLTEQMAANVYQLTQTDNDDVVFSYDLGATALPGDVAMAINNSGLITWTPPRTGNFNQATAVVTVTVTDAASTEGGNNKTDTQMFNIATTPPDSDNDGVADYSDSCPTTSNAGQADLDNDTTHILPQTDPSGIPANGDVDPAGIDANGFITGGDACDEDEDGDGIPDSIEDNGSFPFLDSRNPADAALDEDGDGLSNLDEYRNDTTGATIDSDSVAPIVTAPDDITIDATGLLTTVDLGTATAIDGNDGEVTLFKVALNSTVADCDALTNLGNDIESFRPGRHIVTWVTCDSGKNLGSDNQMVSVKPLVSLSSGQSVGEGQAVTIDVVLNGDAIAYPATIDYTLSGTAVAGDDHDGVAGTVSIAAKGEVGTISFNTLSDGVVEGDETVIVTLSSPSNVALSNAVIHTITITEANVAPKVILQVTQAAAMRGNAVYQPDGNALVLADANDGNGDTLSYDWSASDATLLGVSSIGGVDGNQLDINPATLTLDAFYTVSVTVTDGASPITIDRLLQVKAAPAALTAVDSDGDGINDDDPAEGFADDDADGIPNYLDNISTPANAIENHTVNLQTSVLIETDPGLHIAVGETAVAAEATGVLIGLQDIVEHGGSGGNAVSNAATDYTFLSALLNFEVSGLTENIVSVNVVVPLQSAIQAEAVVRKYNSTGWFDFVVDDFNEIRSASGVGGVCPQPGSDLYTSGLTVGYLCLQLTIQDGGANDADGVRNFIVKDPGGLALAPEPDESEVTVESSGSSSGRVGSASLWFLLMFLMCATYLLYTRKVKYLRKL